MPTNEGTPRFGVDPDDQPIEERVTIYVDGEAAGAPGQDLTGAQILALVGKSPDSFDLYAKGHHGLRIPAEEDVHVEDGARFETRPRI